MLLFFPFSFCWIYGCVSALGHINVKSHRWDYSNSISLVAADGQNLAICRGENSLQGPPFPKHIHTHSSLVKVSWGFFLVDPDCNWYSVTFILEGEPFERKMWALLRHAAAHTPTSLGPLGKTHTAGVRRTGGLSLKAAHIYIQIEAGRARLMCSLWLLTSVPTLFCGSLTCLFSTISFKVTKRWIKHKAAALAIRASLPAVSDIRAKRQLFWCASHCVYVVSEWNQICAFKSRTNQHGSEANDSCLFPPMNCRAEHDPRCLTGPEMLPGRPSPPWDQVLRASLRL